MNKCKINAEKPPTWIQAKQGSLSGVLPKSAKKIIEFQLYFEGTGTRITSSTRIDSAWTRLTIFGNVAAAIVVGLFLSIASDMQNYIENAKPGFWTWLARAYGYPDLRNAIFMIEMTRALAVFLILAIAAEMLIVVYVYPRKEAFAQEILRAMD